MIVLDASAAVELLLNLPRGSAVRDRIADPATQLYAPHLLCIEVLQVLRRREAAGMTTAGAALGALELLGDLDIDYHDHLLLTRRIWALRDDLTAYDAAYAALAETLGATLLTTDARLARAPGHRATIALIEG